MGGVVTKVYKAVKEALFFFLPKTAPEVVSDIGAHPHSTQSGRAAIQNIGHVQESSHAEICAEDPLCPLQKFLSSSPDIVYRFFVYCSDVRLKLRG